MFREIKPQEIKDNPFELIGNTAGDVKLHGNGIWKDRG